MFVSIVSAAILAISAAQADWVTSYQNYQAAVQAGDPDAAMRHAKEAWLQSQVALPPSENRALLAQNYGTQIVLKDPRAAVPALQDAVDLAEQGFGLSNLSLTSAFFQLETAEALSKRNRRSINEALEAMEALSTAEKLAPDNSVLSLRLSALLTERDRAAEASEMLGGLKALLHADETSSFRTLASAEILRAQAVLADKPSILDHARHEAFGERLIEPFVGVHRALLRAEPADAIAEINPAAADLWTWGLVLNGFFVSYETDAGDEARRRARAYGRLDSLLAGKEGCPEIEWKRRNVEYDPKGRGDGAWVGAILVGGRLKRDGRMDDVRIISASPDDLFDIGVLRDAGRWRANVEGLPDACFEDRFTAINFVIGEEN
ncbi:MAG: hypothetical protein AAGI89_09460 [Pseudomonadota bacterium]